MMYYEKEYFFLSTRIFRKKKIGFGNHKKDGCLHLFKKRIIQ